MGKDKGKDLSAIKELARLAIQEGRSREDIVGSLINSGFEYRDIERAFNVLDADGFSIHTEQKAAVHAVIPGDPDFEVEHVSVPDGFWGRILARFSYYRRRLLIPFIVTCLLGVGGWIGFQYYRSSTNIVLEQVASNFQRVRAFSFKIDAHMQRMRIEAGGIALADDTDPKLSLSVKVSDEKALLWDVSIVRPGQGKFFFKANSEQSLNPTWSQFAGRWIGVEPIGDWQGKLSGIGPGPVLAWTLFANDLSGISVFHIRNILREQFVEDAQLVSRENRDGRSLYSYRVNLSESFKRELLGALIGDKHDAIFQRLIAGTWYVSVDRSLELPYQVTVVLAPDDGGVQQDETVVITFSEYGSQFPSLIDAASLDLDMMLRWVRDHASAQPSL